MKFNKNLEMELREQIKDIIYKANSLECKINNIKPAKYISININKRLGLRIESIYILENKANVVYNKEIYEFISLTGDCIKDIKSLNIKDLMNLIYNIIKEFKD